MNNILLQDGSIAPKQVDRTWPLFRLAFRPFFLFGALFSLVSLAAWLGLLSGKVTLSVHGGPLWWHMHEMLFGFVGAIVVGFLLSAVQTWTRLPSIKGVPLFLLFLLWLAARVLLWLPDLISPWTIAAIDLLFFPAAALVLARLVVKAKLWRNIIFIPLLAAMTLANATMHYAAATQRLDLASSSATAMVLLVTLLMCMMGGRVFPMFTANGTQTPRVQPIAWLERAAIISMLLVVISQLGSFALPTWLSATLLFVTAGIHFIRVFRWRIWVTFKTPLVWPLHVSYWCIPIGLTLLGIAELTDWITRSQAIHSLTVGAMGIMILAMIARVSLGHTGRAIQVGRLMNGAFLILTAAFLVRVFGNFAFSDYSHIFKAATALWVLAYGCFFVLYLPILTRPRIDGQPG
ncbi:uncharacterized protein involved in response to NO [Microbulbifer donghaiensis]|uniref:Uncharacterized protein involved in response to NO n=1 Tax=Microbulbifer donghaiensis TaxID=494016 RepID=A0A1M4XTY0_9GAMM|nr:NnrS family protein [Microbulbifer donghaiensis]SHE97037.1 uncharacterized protein involved in response to NO [Microbulbifer donghaiensis]